MNCEVALQLLHERALDPEGAEDAGDLGLAAHLAGCTTCRHEQALLVRLAADLPGALLAPALPDTALRTRLMGGTRHGRALPSFAGAVSNLFARPLAEVRALLTHLEAPDAWRPGFVPGNWIRMIKPGAELGATAVGMLLRTSPGVTLPAHVHDGPERTFVLQGGYVDSLGTEVWAGEYHDMPTSGVHSLLVQPPVECVAAVLVHGGVHLAR